MVCSILCLSLAGCSGKETAISTSLSSPGPELDSSDEEEKEKTTDPVEEIIAPFPETQPFAELEQIPGIKILIATDIHYLAKELTDGNPVFVQMVEHGDGKVTNYIQEIMEALENASKMLDEMKQKTEAAYAQMTNGKQIAEPARSTSVFDGNTSLDFFASQMEQSHRIIDTAQVKFNGPTLNF